MQGYRGADGFAVTDTGENHCLVPWHPPAAIVALLTAEQFSVDPVQVHLQSGRQTLDDHGQTFSMRFTCGDVTEHLIALVSSR